ncbi:MAG: sigma-70 family RNA polymerase sigma factor [Phycisphaerales bacterium]|nr:sigma-70 family RNA polymerase sigma factor [Phycisphaerales bacterium]
MDTNNTFAVTRLLAAVHSGDPRASEQLLPLIYDELRKLARSYMKRESEGQTIQATALVHEAYMRLVGGADVSWDNRGHFFAAAALAMRRILVERARSRGRIKRGGDRQRVDLADHADAGDESAVDLVALDGALRKLEAFDQRKSEVVMLKYFAGLTNDEVAAALGLSSATIRNEWTFARAWLMRELSQAETPEE